MKDFADVSYCKEEFLLIYAFGDQVEDNFSMSLPDGYMDLKYQRDAVIQGYQMLKEYNGFC